MGIPDRRLGRRLALLVALVPLLVWAGPRTAAGAEVDDLALIPADGQEFASVRVADLWKTPVVKKALADTRKRDPKLAEAMAPPGKSLGLNPPDVERFSVAVVDLDRNLRWAIVRTVGPYDQRKVLAQLRGARQRVHQGKKYHIGRDQTKQEVAVWLAGSRVVVTGPEEGVKRCIALAGAKPGRGPLRPIIDRCQGKHHFVAGIDRKGLERLKGNAFLLWVTPVQQVWGTANVAEGVQFEVHAQASDEKQAKALQRTARALIPQLLSVRMPEAGWVWGDMARRARIDLREREVIARSAGRLSHISAPAVLQAFGVSSGMDEPPLVQARSFFGTIKVEQWTSLTEGYRYEFNRLQHGDTMLGKQFTEDGLRGYPLTYYHPSGPVGQLFRACNTDPKRSFAVIDLGVGTMACYGLKGQTVDFYDGEPEMARICFNTADYFTYIADARRRGVHVNLVRGDARKTLAGKDVKYRLIVVDSLSHYAIPSHLVTRHTRQAVKLYFDRLEEDGVVLMHISSRYFDFQPVLANVAADLKVAGYHLSDDDATPAGKNRSHWVALARKPEHLAGVLSVRRWTRDPDQLALLGAALWPSSSPAGRALAGMSFAGLTLADLQARKAQREEGRSGDPHLVRTGWEPLETLKELNRVAAEAPGEIKGLTKRIDAMKKDLAAPRLDPAARGWLKARVASLEQSRADLQRRLARIPERVRLTRKVGVWTDDSWDLLSVFEP